MVLASNLLYLTPDQRAELNDRLFDLLRDYELEDPDHVPEGAERMATMWSMIPDDRGKACRAALPEPVQPPGQRGLLPGYGHVRKSCPEAPVFRQDARESAKYGELGGYGRICPSNLFL